MLWFVLSILLVWYAHARIMMLSTGHNYQALVSVVCTEQAARHSRPCCIQVYCIHCCIILDYVQSHCKTLPTYNYQPSAQKLLLLHWWWHENLCWSAAAPLMKMWSVVMDGNWSAIHCNQQLQWKILVMVVLMVIYRIIMTITLSSNLSVY